MSNSLAVRVHTDRQINQHIGLIMLPLLLMQKVIKADPQHLHDYSTHRQTPLTDHDSSLLFAALGKAKPLISTAAHQKFSFDL